MPQQPIKVSMFLGLTSWSLGKDRTRSRNHHGKGQQAFWGKRVGSRLVSIMGRFLDAEPEAGVMCYDFQPPIKSYKESRSQGARSALKQWFPKWGSCPFTGTGSKAWFQTLPRLMGSGALGTTGSLWFGTCYTHGVGWLPRPPLRTWLMLSAQQPYPLANGPHMGGVAQGQSARNLS